MDQNSLKVVFAVVLLVTGLTVTPAYAQPAAGAPSAGEPIEQESARTFGPRKQVATIIFAGLAGAILGLSTLSFYGRPQEKLTNIAIGAAVGVISGTIYTTYKAATQPRDFYGSALELEELNYRVGPITARNAVVPIFSTSWSF